MSNSFGKQFIITSFGESHGECIGIVIDGCPAGLPLTIDDIQQEVDKRKPQPGTYATTRTEGDKVEVLSGVFKGHTTGAPLCLIVRNKDVNSTAYGNIESLFRPGHADYTSYVKYGGFSDYRGGGRFSGRITAGFVMAGAIARKLLRQINIEVIAHTIEINGIRAEKKGPEEIKETAFADILHCADTQASKRMLKAIKEARASGDSLGGIVEGIALNVPAGLGEPVFDTMDGELAKALLAIPAIKGIEFGAGFSATGMKGSENNDAFILREARIETVTNNAGGILGGISTGMPIVVRVAVKPTPSIAKKQKTVDIKQQSSEIETKGRHDTCIVPRVVPVVEAMIAVTICDFSLRAGIMPRVL